MNNDLDKNKDNTKENETPRSESREIIDDVTSSEYKYGFVTDIDTEIIPKGINEDVIRLISAKKGEPEWLLEFRLKAYRHWLTLEMPDWAHLKIPLSTIKPSVTMLPHARKRDPKVLTRLTLNYLTRSTSLAFLLKSKKHCRVWQLML